jgi:DNA-binding NtrC family response regulator
VDDIPILANYFLRIHSERYGKSGMKMSTHAMEKLSNYGWPGNVRELQHAVEKAVIMSDNLILKPSDFVFSAIKSTIHKEMTLDEMENKLISDAIRRYGNNISVVASKLGITRQTLYNKMKKYDL